MKVLKDTQIPYSIQDEYFITPLPSPFYGECRNIPGVGILHDAPDYKKRDLQEGLAHACELFTRQIRALEKLDRQLTEREKDKLASTFHTLLDLHTVINRRKK